MIQDNFSNLALSQTFLLWVWAIYRMSQEERSIFWEVIVWVIRSKNVYMNMSPILNDFRDRGIWLYSGLAWAPSIVLPSRRAAPLSEACESVWSVSWLLWLLVVTLLGCCEKSRTSSHMPNMLIWYMFMAFAMVVPLLLLKNTVDGFLCVEFRIVVFYKVFNTLRECGTLPSAHVSSERARKQNMEEQENILDMVQRSPTTSTRKLSALSVFHEHVYGEHSMKTACTHFTHSLCKIYTQGTVRCV